MDIHCPKCGEPWDFDCLHDEVDHRRASTSLLSEAEYEVAYNEVRDDFRRQGCYAFTGYGAKCGVVDKAVAEATAALMDLMPDDFDGIAAVMQDAGY